MLWPMWKGRPAAAAAAGTEMGGIAGWGGRRDIYEQSVCSDSGRVRACAGVCGRVRACACGRVELGGGGRGARLRVGAVCKA